MSSSLINNLCSGSKGIISIIGAGGKTSLMFRLAKELAETGKKVLTTTTTKIFFPDKSLSPETIITHSAKGLIEASEKCLRQYFHFSAGNHHDKNSGKLEGLSPDTIDAVWQTGLFDWIIVEADGSRQKPLKATAAHEPVVPASTTCLVHVIGLDSVGRPLDEHHVHRAGIFSHNTGLAPGKPVDEQSIAISIAVEIKKAADLCAASDHILFLNKADTQTDIASGMKIKYFLTGNNQISRIMIASLKDESCIKKEIP